MLLAVLSFTLVESYAASFLPTATMGSFSMFMTLLAGLKFIFRPVMKGKESNRNRNRQTAILQSVFCGMAVGLICGFIGTGGGTPMLLVLVSALSYELKTAVGTSVFIMALIGKKGPELQEKCGYYGERIVLRTQQIGLNTCWVAMTYKKNSAVQVDAGEKLSPCLA